MCFWMGENGDGVCGAMKTMCCDKGILLLLYFKNCVAMK